MTDPVSDEEAILAPALRRAAALSLHAHDLTDTEGITCILSDITTVEHAKDVILALLLLNRVKADKSMLRGIVARAALKET
jgi:hypothetical protein